MSNYKDVYIGIGANLGDPLATILQAIQLMQSLPEVSAFRISKFYQTSPISDLPQPDFVNAVCYFKTLGTPQKLFEKLQHIEIKLGKQPKNKNEPRPIDLDILFFGKENYSTSNLEIPHPRWTERLFVLKPLSDLTSDIILNDTAFHIPTLISQFPYAHQEVVEIADFNYTSSSF